MSSAPVAAAAVNEGGLGASPRPASPPTTSVAQAASNSSLSGSRHRPPSLHVHIATNTPAPGHSFVEKIHTPTRLHADGSGHWSEDSLDTERHAHLADDVQSPHGLVRRRATPINKQGPAFEQPAGVRFADPHHSHELSAAAIHATPGSPPATLTSHASTMSDHSHSHSHGHHRQQDDHCPSLNPMVLHVTSLAVVAGLAFCLGYLVAKR